VKNRKFRAEMEYKNTAAFINRQAEMEYLKNWIQQDPGQILFIQSKGFVKEVNLIRLLDGAYYTDRQSLLEEINNLVRNNYLYYNPTLAQYKMQGRSMEIGLERYVREIAYSEN
jgi:hypothetical protein